MTADWQAITFHPDGTIHVNRTPVQCRTCGGPINSPDVPYCDACVDAFVEDIEAEDVGDGMTGHARRGG